MRSFFGQRGGGLPYRTLALCLTTFVLVANISFWMFTSSQPGDEHQRIAMKSAVSNHRYHQREFPVEPVAPRFEYIKRPNNEASRSIETALKPLEPGQWSNNDQQAWWPNQGRSLQPPVRRTRTYGKEALEGGLNVLVYGELLEASPREVSELVGRVVPNTVHYIWCGNGTFGYRHFLSVMSVWRVLEPDAIEFRYETRPKEDKYNTWFTFIRTHLPAFQASPLPDWVKGPQCGDVHGLETLSDRGGVLVSPDVVLYPRAATQLLYNNFTVAFKSDMSIGLAVGTAKNEIFRPLIDIFTPKQSRPEAGVSLSSGLTKHLTSEGSERGAQMADETVLKEKKIMAILQSSSNQSGKMLYCGDTALIKNMDRDIKKPDLPDQLDNFDSKNANLCLSVDSRLEPRHVIQGSVENPLVSLLHRYVYNTDRGRHSGSSKSKHDPQPLNMDSLSGKVSNPIHLNGTHAAAVRKHMSADAQLNTTPPPSEKTTNTRLPRLADKPEAVMDVPRIVHYVWFGRKEMTFGMYLSFLSTVYVLKPNRIFIHGDGLLTGKIWVKVKKHPLVTLVYRDPPLYIFSRAVVYTSHRSDIVRADVLDKYGGVYVDWDAYWLSSPDQYLLPTSISDKRSSQTLLTSEEISGSAIQFNSTAYLYNTTEQNSKLKNSTFLSTMQTNKTLPFQGRRVTEADAVVSRDHIPRPPFPDTINMGVVLARPRSKFIRAWRAALVDYRSRDFLYNAVELPYKVFEMFSQSVVIDDRLQVTDKM
ncbi:hypothetical protein ElyMa_002182600 [Elysia marginata]|uniref:Nucleotide-diphospho-sugar transferase domain-containing protein n=1 Tax=Elysia marginata TaxID=1093978 RepID=A0AAV4FR72_9GAST|nr:hypothetical protein ElyMa_002182600 [Elysia marginata]